MRRFSVFAATMAIMVMAVTASGCGVTTPTSGEKIGTPVRVADTGIVCTTHEAQIMRGGLQNGSGTLGTAFEFTVRDEATFQKLKDAMEKQQEIKLRYSAPSAFYNLCSSEDGVFATSVEVRDTPSPSAPVPDPLR